jgi:hypothetical protein
MAAGWRYQIIPRSAYKGLISELTSRSLQPTHQSSLAVQHHRLEQDQVTLDQTVDGHWSAHKEYNLTTKIDYRSEKIGFTTTCMPKKKEHFNIIIFLWTDDTDWDKKNHVFYIIVLLRSKLPWHSKQFSTN